MVPFVYLDSDGSNASAPWKSATDARLETSLLRNLVDLAKHRRFSRSVVWHIASNRCLHSPQIQINKLEFSKSQEKERLQNGFTFPAKYYFYIYTPQSTKRPLYGRRRIIPTAIQWSSLFDKLGPNSFVCVWEYVLSIRSFVSYQRTLKNAGTWAVYFTALCTAALFHGARAFRGRT